CLARPGGGLRVLGYRGGCGCSPGLLVAFGFARAGFELRARRREVDLRVVVLDAERGERTFDLQACVERQRTGVDLPAGEVAPFLDLVLVARLDRKADLQRVGPERLHGRALHLFLQSLQAPSVAGELLYPAVGALTG